MESDNGILWLLFWIYGFLYVFLYLFYNLIIHILHSSFSVISVPAIVLPYLLLLLFQFNLWKKTANHLKSDRKVKIKFRVITILSIIPPLYCAVLLGINEYNSIFTVEKWMKDETERVYMIENFLKKYDLNGMTIDEVTTLLGTPYEDSHLQQDSNIVYFIGYGFIPIDSIWLVLYFDDSKQVKKYEFVSD